MERRFREKGWNVGWKFDMSGEIKSKKVLLFQPEFYGYEKYTVKGVKKTGAEVYSICTNLHKTSGVYRYFVRFVKPIKNRYREKYFADRLKEMQDVDIVFMIAEAAVDEKLVDSIKKRYKRAFYILYLWDSVNNCKNVLDYYKKFDRVWTFDKSDSEKYGWRYRPLFYISQLVKNRNKIYDISCICTVSEDRINMIYQLKKQAERRNLQVYVYLYSPVLTYIKNRVFLRREAFRKLKLRDIKFRPLSLEKTNAIYGKSKCVIDYASKTQTGMTMRTIEALGHKCKLVTNNATIKAADFYDERNVFYCNEECLEIPTGFCTDDYQEVDRSLYDKYSLKSWIEEILNG